MKQLRLICLLISAPSVFAGARTFGPGDHQFQVPSNVTSLTIEVVGGGGGGGASCYGPGGNGGNNAYKTQTFGVATGELLSIDVGSGGPGGCGGGGGGGGGGASVSGPSVYLAISGGDGGDGTGGGCDACGGNGADGQVILSW